MKTLKNFEKKSHKPKKGRRKSYSAEKLVGGPFWVLHFKVEAFGGVQNQVLSTFGKSESFTKNTYAMSEKSDEKKEKKLATVIAGLFSLEKRRLKIYERTLCKCKRSTAWALVISVISIEIVGNHERVSQVIDL